MSEQNGISHSVPLRLLALLVGLLADLLGVGVGDPILDLRRTLALELPGLQEDAAAKVAALIQER